MCAQSKSQRRSDQTLYRTHMHSQNLEEKAPKSHIKRMRAIKIRHSAAVHKKSEVEPCPLLPFYCANLSC